MQIVTKFMASEIHMMKLCKLGEVSFFCVDSSENGELQALQDGVKDPLDVLFRSLSAEAAFIIFDGVTRSGRTLGNVYQAIAKESSCVWTFSVAVSIRSGFIPTWYGCLYEESEHVTLTRDGATSSTSVYSKPKSFSSPAIVLRLPREDDPEFMIDSPASMTRYKSEDRFFDSSTNSKQIFVIEWASKPIGYVAFHSEDSVFWIDYILICNVAGKDRRGAGIALINHVEAYAKMGKCRAVSLWAIRDKMDFYTKRGFTSTGGKSIMIGPEGRKEEYVPMTHVLTNDSGHYIF